MSYCCLFVCLFSGPATDDKHCFDCLFVVSTINLLGPGRTLMMIVIMMIIALYTDDNDFHHNVANFLTDEQADSRSGICVSIYIYDRFSKYTNIPKWTLKVATGNKFLRLFTRGCHQKSTPQSQWLNEDLNQEDRNRSDWTIYVWCHPLSPIPNPTSVLTSFLSYTTSTTSSNVCKVVCLWNIWTNLCWIPTFLMAFPFAIIPQNNNIAFASPKVGNEFPFLFPKFGNRLSHSLCRKFKTHFWLTPGH